MNSFSVIRKKTPFQKHREEEEAKKKRADEEAARLYEEFVESFKGDDVPGGKAFVRGETINPDDPGKTGNEDMYLHLYLLDWQLHLINRRIQRKRKKRKDRRKGKRGGCATLTISWKN